MPKVTIANEKKEIEVPAGANLRESLRREGTEVYRGLTRYLNCFGHGTCGECRVLVKQGMENLSGKGVFERVTLFRMLSTIDHENEMRLSCQCAVNGDVTIETQPGMNLSGEVFWQKPYPNKSNIRVNAIGPGPIETPLLAKDAGGNPQAYSSAVPMVRIGQPPVGRPRGPGCRSKWTGQAVPIDGGYVSR